MPSREQGPILVQPTSELDSEDVSTFLLTSFFAGCLTTGGLEGCVGARWILRLVEGLEGGCCAAADWVWERVD